MEETRDSRTVPRLMAAGEIIKLTGLSTARVHELMRQPGFPKPIATLGVGKIWLAEDVEAWDRERKIKAGKGAEA